MRQSVLILAASCKEALSQHLPKLASAQLPAQGFRSDANYPTLLVLHATSATQEASPPCGTTAGLSLPSLFARLAKRGLRQQFVTLAASTGVRRKHEPQLSSALSPTAERTSTSTPFEIIARTTSAQTQITQRCLFFTQRRRHRKRVLLAEKLLR